MRRRLAVWLVGSMLLAMVIVLVGCAVSKTVSTTPAPAHPSYSPGTACDATGCHTPDSFKPAYTHKKPYEGPCETCHNLTSWKRVTYKHQDASFDQGMHPLVGCAMCHTEGEALPTGGCKTCHDAPHGGWNECRNCHIPIAWRITKPAPSGHLSLKGGHSDLICQDCHKAPTEPAVPRTCTNCHGTNHGGLTTCQHCHDPSLGWGKPKADFDHDEFFVRKGIHAKLKCGQCHPNDRFAGTPRECVGCHGVHHGGLTQCGNCHTPTASKGFKFTTFVHSSVFQLEGKHLDAYNAGHCSGCHPSNKFAIVAGTKCVSCHKSGNPNTTPPGSPHGSSVSNCKTCHTPLGFSFSNLLTPYQAHPIALGGEHADRPCTLCHTSLVFTSPTKTCVTCHSAGSTNPPGIPHVGPLACLDCHTPTTWSHTHFTHPEISGFGFISPHNMLEFGGYPTGCVNCHPSSTAVVDFTTASCDTCHK